MKTKLQIPIQISESLIVKLRPWVMSDLLDLVKYADNWNIAKNLTNRYPFPYTENDGRNYLGFASENKFIFAIEVNGTAVGSIGFEPQSDIYERNWELGYWLAEEFWKKGIITKVVGKFVETAFESNPNLMKITAKTFAHNISSQKVLTNNGFGLEAVLKKNIYKNGEYIDEKIYSIFKH